MSKSVVLVADDVEMNRNVIRRFLENDFEILEAEDGVRALEILESTPVDALLLDIIMPGMDGLQVLERLRGQEKYNALAILVATSAKEKTERTALNLGADDVVSKPYDPIVIKKRLQNVLALHSAERQAALGSGGDIDALAEDRLQQLLKPAQEAVSNLHSIASIVRASTDNPQLVVEMADRIALEADKLQALFAGRL